MVRLQPKPDALTSLARLVHTRSGLVLGPDKLYLLEMRLAPLLRLHGLATLEDLTAMICAEGEASLLARDVVEAMTTNETTFFRDGRPFEHLSCHAIPRLLQARSPGHTLRIWSAAASSGQEAYSVAMILTEAASRLCPVSIVGTDIARHPIEQAKGGRYTTFQVQRGLTTTRLHRHFTLVKTADGDRWQVRPALSAMCKFLTWNLLDDLEPLGLFDIVFCRNVLMYFDSPTKTRVLSNIAKRLRPDGLLYIGGTETAAAVDSLRPFEQERSIYQRTD